MDVTNTIKSRFSVRKYIDKPVEKKLIYKILDIARFSPSGHNMQPWEVAIVTGKTKEELSKRLMDDFDNKKMRNYDYNYAVRNMPAFINNRRKACNAAIFKHKHIDPAADKEALHEHIMENFKFFGAPVELFFLREKHLGDGTLIDIGIFAQSVMLAAWEFGLGSCAQASIAAYPDTIRNTLKLPDNKIVLFGIALGYPDLENYINKLRMDRDAVDAFSAFYD